MSKLEERLRRITIDLFSFCFKGTFPIFQGFHSVHAKKSLESSLVLSQHEQFYTEGISVVAPFPLGWIKLAPKFKEFPAPTAIFKDF